MSTQKKPMPEKKDYPDLSKILKTGESAQSEETPPQGGAIPQVRIKTISARYERRINPQVIDPKRGYESMGDEVNLWADLEPGADEIASIKALQNLVEEIVTGKITEKILQLREYKNFSGETPMRAIEEAFKEYHCNMTGNDLTLEELTGAWEIFKKGIDTHAAKLAAR